MRVRIVLGVGLALVVAGLVVVLSQSGERLAGTSFVPPRAFTVVVPPHGRACQPATLVPDDSAGAQILVGTYGRPRPALALTFADDELVARGRAPGGPREGDIVVPLDRVVEGNRVVTACVRNLGPVRVALGGDIATADGSARIHGRPSGGVVGFRYLRAGDESWWAIMPEVAQRFGLGKASIFGTWTLPVLALILAGTWFAALRLLVREGR